MKTTLKIILAGLLLIALPLAYNSCGQANFLIDTEDSKSGTTTGNPMVPLNVAAFRPASSQFSSRICVEDIFFEDLGNYYSYPMGNAIVNLDPLGFDLPTVSLPRGTYTKITFRLTAACGFTQELTNAQGSFTTTDPNAIQFWGQITVSGPGTRINLNIQPVISALDSVSSNAEIVTQAMSVVGTF